MPVATAPLVDGWKFFVSLSPCSARFVWKRSRISITLRRLISFAMAELIPVESPGTTERFFSVFIIILFVVEFLKTVYTGSRADLTIHISESWLVAWHIEETMRTPGLVLFCRRGLETELGDMLLDQVGKKQMREQR